MDNSKPPEKLIVDYFVLHELSTHKQYLAMRRFFLDKASAETVAIEFNYTVSTVYTIARDFKKRLAACKVAGEDPFFLSLKPGRKKLGEGSELTALAIAYRKKQLSVPDIKIILDSKGFITSERLINDILKSHGFVRLPKRSGEDRQEILKEGAYAKVSPAPVSEMIPFDLPEKFSSKGVGLLSFLPIIKSYGIDKIIERTNYPGSSKINRLSAILSFLALKLSDVKRYGHDDGWCMDRGLGMFAGLNVLPKTTWFSAYSSAVSRASNVAFLKELNAIWLESGLLSDTVNLDFTAIPYWGDEGSFENNWSGKRSKALISIQAALAQDSEGGIICYGDTTVKHENQDKVILEFLDFYHSKKAFDNHLKYLVFDSKFTTLANLGHIDDKGIKFITIQRKNQSLDEFIASIPDEGWETTKIKKANNKSRTVSYSENFTSNNRYGKSKQLRQIFIKGNRLKPSTIITNDFEISPGEIIQKYSKRWLVETEIAEHVDFFHLNRNSSGIVIKVDFDLTMTILAHNLYRLLAMNLPGYSHYGAKILFDKFIDNYGEIIVGSDVVTIKLNRKRSLPLLLETLPEIAEHEYQWIGGKRLNFVPHSHT